MGRYYRQAEKEEKPTVHPIWRGIGCLFFIIIPLIAFAISVEMVNRGIPQQYFPITPDLGQQFNVPGFGFIPLLYTLAVTVAITVILGAFMTVIYSIVYRMVGPPKYGRLDAAPVKRKTKKSR